MNRATIIGAGPAGSTAAILLARAGWQVTLIEQHRFPRDKVCGESLSALGAKVLQRLGLFDTLVAGGAIPITRAALHAPDGRSSIQPLPAPMWGLSRARLDTLLLDATRNCGVQILQPARCESIHPAITCRDLTTNQLHILQSAWIVLADGKGAFLPRRPGTADLGIKTHFDHLEVRRDTVELFGVNGHYVGVAPIEANRWNVAFSVPITRVQRFDGDLPALWNAVMNENPLLGRRLSGSRRIGEFLASSLPRFPVGDEWPDRVIPLGNAAAALEPIGGEGMGLAMHSAEIACEELIAAHRDQRPTDLSKVRDLFKSIWQTRSLACRTIARLLSTPLLAGEVTDWAASSETMSRNVLAWMGKR